ncbi:MAG: FecR domain-containing protein [Blastocatellia bacterium]|nr:FecR domain-containing protein [Blastocatellia bacterium]
MIPSTPSRYVLTLSLFLSLFALTVADTPIIRVARISLIEGEVSYRRANHEDQSWYDASTNTPLGENDQIFTGQRGRAEIQLTGRNIVRLDSDTSFKIAQFTTAVTQIGLPLGTATFRVDSLDRRQFDIVDASDASRDEQLYFEVNTPTVSVTLLKTGDYRINVREDGLTEVIVRSGEAEVYSQELGTIVVKKGRRLVVESDSSGYYQMAKLEDKDTFDRWNDRRDDELSYQANSLSARYVPQGIPGVYDLDRYGDWWQTEDYGYVWSPRTVATGWSPYRVGAWRWYSDWGWTWISTEPWGWAPYHYGRWSYVRNRWCWIPRDRVSVGFSWSPALVTWFGWGNGYNRGYNNGYRDGYRDGRYDSVGWIPLGPGEHYYNPYRRGGNTTIVNNTNIYGNGNTVINQRIDTYRNYNAPGGVTRMDGRRFETRRVAVNNFDNTPIQQPVLRSAVTMRGDSVRPVVTSNGQPTVNPAADPTNRSVTQREVVSRNFNRGSESIRPGGERRGEVINGVPTLRSSDVDRTARPERFGRETRNQNTNRTTNRVDVPTDPSRVTNRNTDTTDRANTGRNTNSEDRRADRNVDRPVIERPVTPTPRNTEQPAGDRTERPNRPYTFGGDNNRRDANPPTYTPRRTETERRESTPRRVEETPRYEAPRPEPPRESRREERPAPSRETRSERYERPSAPPPRQEAAPRYEAPRQTERPSVPPPSNSGGGRGERPSRRPSN